MPPNFEERAEKVIHLTKELWFGSEYARDIKCIAAELKAVYEEGLESAAKIAEMQGCYHNQGACGPYIAKDIRALKSKEG